MTAQELKNSILQLAIQGKLVPQDPNDEPATVLLEKIKEERNKLIKEKKIKKEKYSEIYKDETDNHYYEKFEDGTVNDITEEIPFDIPDNWKWVHFENLGYFISGYTPKREEISSNGNIPYFKVSDMNTNGNEIYLIYTDNYLCTNKYYPKNTIVYPKNGGAVFTNKRRILKYDSVVDLNTGGFCCYSFAYLNFMFLLFSNIDFRQYYKGTALPTLDMDKIKRIYIPFPPLNEQERIKNKIEILNPIINLYDSKYNEIEALNTSYKEELKKSILQYAIQGKLVKRDPNDEPAEVLINKILEEKRELIKTKQIKKENLSVIYKDSTDNQFYEKFDDDTIVNITDEIPFDIPSNWCWTKLRNIGVYKKGPFGSALTKSMFVPKSNETIKVYEQKNAIQKNATLGEYYITKDYFERSLTGFEIFPNDIIVSCAGTIGETYVMPNEMERGIINQALMRMRILELFPKDYFLLYFDYVLKKSSAKKSSGSAIKNIPPFDIFKEFLVAVPPIAEQKRILGKLNIMFNIIKTAE